MAKKPTSLLDTINAMPVEDCPGGYGWPAKFRKSFPDLYDQVIDVMKRYAGGDPAVCNKFANRVALCHWLTGTINASGYAVAEEKVLNWYDREKRLWRKS